jgi:hypothetical protein
MRKSELKKLIREQILKEDVYWGNFNKEKPQTPSEDEIMSAAEEYIDGYIGLDSASVIVRSGGSSVEVFSKNKNAKPDPMMEREWEDIAMGLANFLGDSGVGDYEPSGWNYRMCRLVKV